MITKLGNENIEVMVRSTGAELAGIYSKKDGMQYLWQADPEFWGRHAPILFPIVGKLKDDMYIYDGATYSMGQHGFARDFEFVLVHKHDDSVLFRLQSNEETLSKYPFRFQLDVGYKINANEVIVDYTVKNADSNDMYFSIGAHPGFNCPLTTDEKMEDYYLEFDTEESIDTYVLDGGLISETKLKFLENSKKLQLTKELFKYDAIILEGLKSNKVSIISAVTNRSITVEFPGFPFLGIWSKPGGAPFVCIEPWYGIADCKTAEGNLKDKKGIVKLGEGQVFGCRYKIRVE